MSKHDAWLGIDNPYLCEVGPSFLIHKEVKPAWQALQSAAHNDGIDCQLISSYRDFHRQLAIWNRKWRGDATLFDTDGEIIEHSQLSDNEKIDAILTWSALPGGSRHHWGTDIDVYDKRSVDNWSQNFDLVDAEYRENGPCYALACWLDKNLHEFGFARPFMENKGGVAVELWHLTHSQCASEFEHARNIEQLERVLSEADMEGKAAVLSRLDELYHRYVLNEGIV
ncbi:M15 family metallopeptidase [Alteromonas sp. C1M14]|uniref:M15 family metallopeptidase n=1 Tax=Alteromonas sp. C1M14 TaxID=2841567 RepID=UPI001C099868|nr:M15 family metallopeptidase [Alteromonas sp. C1M14]MBU2978900.1 M15 family metallopeptidase [Alteromonas sp. C1M14]